jgi:uncharacterized protein YbjT (DUF2867 family)
MYAITGITGKVGGALANALLEAGLPPTTPLLRQSPQC